MRDWLDCDHCGGPAIVSPDGMFADGEGGACISCGMPGHVSCDAETSPYWWTSDCPNDVCADAECEDCRR